MHISAKYICSNTIYYTGTCQEKNVWMLSSYTNYNASKIDIGQ